MINKNETITPLQTGLVIVQTQVGVGILSLPFNVHMVSKQDAWISTIIAGLTVNLLIWIIILFARRYPSFTLFEALPKLAGKAIGNLLSFIYIVYFILIGSLILISYSNVIYKWVFDETPIWATLMLMILISSYLAKESIRIIARFHGFVTILVFILIGIMTYSYKNFDIRYIMPVGQTGILNIIKGSKEAAISLLGYEMLLIIYPSIINAKKAALKTATIANLSVTALYVFVVFTSLVVFSPAEIELVPEPILYMLKAFSSRVIDRIDLLLLSIWMVCVTTSYVTYLYMAGKGLQTLFHIKKQSVAVYIAGFLTFWLPLKLQGETKIAVFNKWLSTSSFVFTALLPLLLLLFSIIAKRKEKRGTNL